MNFLRYIAFPIALFCFYFLRPELSIGQEKTENPNPEELPIDWTQPDFWQPADKNATADSWEFADGEIRLVRPQGGKGSLVSRPLPPNFELTFDWKLDAKTNTGLKYRVRKYGSKYYGIEYQIIG